jgi:hypothetical protein
VDNDSTATAFATFAVACFAAIVLQLFALVVRSSFHTQCTYLRANGYSIADERVA